MALRQRLAELEARAGAGPVVNLARTSLARVHASSVNGGRAMDDPFFGVRNAFDDDEPPLVGSIAYTDWLGDLRDGWIEVQFERGVTVTEVEVRVAPGGMSPPSAEGTGGEVRLVNDDGQVIREAWRAVPEVVETFRSGGPGSGADGTVAFPRPQPAIGVTRLSPPRSGVRSVRIHVPGGVSIREVRILGVLPPGAPTSPATPRVLVDARTAGLAALASFAAWKDEWFSNVSSTVEEREDAVVVVLRSPRGVIGEAVVDRESGECRFTPRG